MLKKKLVVAAGLLSAGSAFALVVDGTQSVLATYGKVTSAFGTAGIGLDQTNGPLSQMSYAQSLVRASAKIDLPRRSISGVVDAAGAGPAGLPGSAYALDAYARLYEFAGFTGSGTFSYDLLFDGFLSAAGGAPFGSQGVAKASLSVYDVTGLALPVGGTTLPLLNISPTAKLVHCQNIVTAAYAILPVTVIPASGPCSATVSQKQFANEVALASPGSFLVESAHRYAFVFDLALTGYVSGDGSSALADFGHTLGFRVTGLGDGVVIASSTGPMVSAVPEPGSATLAGFGLLSLWLLLRFRTGTTASAGSSAPRPDERACPPRLRAARRAGAIRSST